MYLSDKVAVITGGGRGIGRATALKLASAGATVVVVARTMSEIESVVAEIEEQGGQAMARVVDVTLNKDVEFLGAELQEIFGQVDILVNCAGVALIAPLSATSEADWDQVIDTNLKGTFLCIRALLDLLASSKSALVVNIASKVGITGHATVTAYTAAKAGVIGFSRALADELGPDRIRVVAICPGPVDTPMRWAATPNMDPALAIPAGAVAETILFLAKLGDNATTGEIVLETIAYDENLVQME